MTEETCWGDVDEQEPEDVERRLPFRILTPELKAVEDERSRRNARDIADAERASKVPFRTGRAKMRDLVAQAVCELEVRREHGLQGFKTGINSFDELAARSSTRDAERSGLALLRTRSESATDQSATRRSPITG